MRYLITACQAIAGWTVVVLLFHVTTPDGDDGKIYVGGVVLILAVTAVRYFDKETPK